MVASRIGHALMCQMSVPAGNKYRSPQSSVTSCKKLIRVILRQRQSQYPCDTSPHEPSYKSATRIARTMAASLQTRNPLYLLRECKLARASGISPIAAFKSFRNETGRMPHDHVAGICNPPNGSVAIPERRPSREYCRNVVSRVDSANMHERNRLLLSDDKYFRLFLPAAGYFIILKEVIDHYVDSGILSAILLAPPNRFLQLPVHTPVIHHALPYYHYSFLLLIIPMP